MQKVKVSGGKFLGVKKITNSEGKFRMMGVDAREYFEAEGGKLKNGKRDSFNARVYPWIY